MSDDTAQAAGEGMSEERGWIEGRWEDEQPEGRPRRRYWRLTTWGAWRAWEALGRTGGGGGARA